MTRRRGLRIFVAVVLLSWLGWCAYLLLSAASDLRAGRDAAQRARGDLALETIADGAALPGLRAANDRFQSAASDVGNPLLAPLKLLPVVGRQLRSVDALASAAADATGAAAVALDRMSTLLQRPGSGPGERLSQVSELADVMQEAARQLPEGEDLGPRLGLLAPLADARNEISEELAEATQTIADASAGADVALRLLEGPRRYLLVAANNAEMRGGSGMWLSGGVLETGGGRLSLGEVRPLYEVADPPDGSLDIGDPDLAAVWGASWGPEDDWRALMPSPRLAASAQLALRMWEAARGEQLDGLLVVDAEALAALVRTVGPVQVDGRTLAAEEVVPFVLHEQYLDESGEERESQDRRQALSVLARQAFDALDRGAWDVTTLVGNLGDAIAGRHLLAWSRNADEQDAWETARMSGQLSPESVFVSVLNGAANKLDWFLPAQGVVESRRAGDRQLVTVRFTMENRTPVGLPRYVAGPFRGPSFDAPWPAGTYAGLVAVNVPGAAEDIRISGGSPTSIGGADGPTAVVSTTIELAPGATETVVVEFSLPPGQRELRIEPSARIPGVEWSFRDQRWQDGEARSLRL